MMARHASGRRGLMWAVIGGIILIGAIATIVVVAVTSPRGTEPTTPPSASATPSTDPPDPPNGDAVVDPGAAERGWTAEPITTDAEEYIRAALASASTFDTTKSTREEWLAFLDTWFTPDPRFTADVDRQADLVAARLELRQGVVLPQEEWDSLAANDGRVVAAVTGDVAFVEVPDDTSGAMSIGTADVKLTFTQDDGSGTESEFDDVVRVSVQVLCGPESVPAPESAQRTGDCKVVRYFTEPLEP